VPRLCQVYPGICLTTEGKPRKNLSQGSRRMSVGTMKTEYTQQSIHNSILFLSLFSVQLFSRSASPTPPLLYSFNVRGLLICPIQFVRVGIWTRRASLPLSKLIRYGQTVEWRRWRHADVRCTVHDSSLTSVNRTLRCVFKNKPLDFSQTHLRYFI